MSFTLGANGVVILSYVVVILIIALSVTLIVWPEFWWRHHNDGREPSRSQVLGYRIGGVVGLIAGIVALILATRL